MLFPLITRGVAGHRVGPAVGLLVMLLTAGCGPQRNGTGEPAESDGDGGSPKEGNPAAPVGGGDLIFHPRQDGDPVPMAVDAAPRGGALRDAPMFERPDAFRLPPRPDAPVRDMAPRPDAPASDVAAPRDAPPRNAQPARDAGADARPG